MTVTEASGEVSRGFRRRGVVIMAIFALVWALAGSSGIANATAGMTVLVAAVIGTVAVVLLGLRGGPPAAERTRRLPAD